MLVDCPLWQFAILFLAVIATGRLPSKGVPVTIEQFYELVVMFLPDWVMGLLMLAAVIVCYRRYRIRRNLAILALILPLTAFMLFYVWGLVFEPLALARLATGRCVSFGLALGIIAWGLLTDERNE